MKFKKLLLFSLSFLIAGSVVQSADAYSNSTSTVTAHQYNYLVSYKEANAIALKKVPGATVTNMELKKSGNTFIYEIGLYLNGTSYELVINAKTGSGISVLKYLDNSYANSANGTLTSVDLNLLEQQILSNTGTSNYSYTNTKTNNTYRSNNSYSNATTSTNLIGTARAKEIALAKVPNGKVVYVRQDRDDGRTVYEGKITKDYLEYDFEIDAYTGNIREWDVDHIYD